MIKKKEKVVDRSSELIPVESTQKRRHTKRKTIAPKRLNKLDHAQVKARSSEVSMSNEVMRQDTSKLEVTLDRDESADSQNDFFSFQV